MLFGGGELLRLKICEFLPYLQIKQKMGLLAPGRKVNQAWDIYVLREPVFANSDHLESEKRGVKPWRHGLL